MSQNPLPLNFHATSAAPAPSAVKLTAPVFRIRSRRQAEALIADIRHAVRRSAHTGGGYGVYRRDDDGRTAVAIEANIRFQEVDL